MRYIVDVSKVFPIALLMTAIIYGLIYIVIKGKREKPPAWKIVAEYALTGYFVMFIYITQVLTFGNGLGELLNLSPLRPIFIAIKYGYNNAGMFAQMYLNVLMCIPLGFLLPIVFPKRFNSFLPVMAVSFAATFFTEVSQLLAGRAADIDDVIANTLGGMLGFAVYIFCYGVYYHVKLKKQRRLYGIKRYPFKVFVSILLVLLTISPLVIVKSLDARQTFGYVYYGHLQPDRIEIVGDISDEGSTATVYKTFVKETEQEVMDRLKRITGFKGEFTRRGDIWRFFEGSNIAAFIYKYNTWHVTYKYGKDISIDKTKLPTKEECIDYALKHARRFEIDTSVLEFLKFDNKYEDGAIRVVFTEKPNEDDVKVWGNVSVTIGEKGKLLSISDSRTYHKAFKEVETISPKQAVKVAQEVGVGKIDVTAYVTDVTKSFYFQKEKGYLIPTWEIKGYWHAQNNDVYNWTPNIDARK